MSVDFDDVNYCSLYGTTRVVPSFLGSEYTSQSVSITGSVSAGGSAFFYASFEYGVPYDPAIPGDPDDNGITDPTAIPLPSFTAYVSSGTSPNNGNNWFQVDTNPRPLTLPSSLGNLNMNIYTYRNNSTASAPTLYTVVFLVYNPYGGTATITPTTVNVIGYGFSNS